MLATHRDKNQHNRVSVNREKRGDCGVSDTLLNYYHIQATKDIVTIVATTAVIHHRHHGRNPRVVIAAAVVVSVVIAVAIIGSRVG